MLLNQLQPFLLHLEQHVNLLLEVLPVLLLNRLVVLHPLLISLQLLLQLTFPAGILDKRLLQTATAPATNSLFNDILLLLQLSDLVRKGFNLLGFVH